MLRVAGVDGCPGGWAIVESRSPSVGARSKRRVTASFAKSLEVLVGRVRSGELDAVAIDMPIGLLDVHPRPADVATRSRLGARKSSVFPTPLRVTLDAPTYEVACERSRAACGKALSKQAWFLLPKIRELDQLIEPDDQDRVVEAHPERAFARLSGAPLEHGKATADGAAERRILLQSRFGAVNVDRVLASGAAPRIDLFDALVLVSTAERVATGVAERFGGEVDATGLRAEMVE